MAARDVGLISAHFRFRAHSATPTPAGGFATAAFNVGAALGPWLGGTAIGAGLGYRSPLWVGAVLVALSLVVASSATGRRNERADGRRMRTSSSR